MEHAAADILNDYTDDELMRMARRHHRTMLVWLVMAVFWTVVLFGALKLNPVGPGHGPVIVGVCLLVALQLTAVSCVFGVRLSVGDGVFMGAFNSLWCAVPLFNLAVVPLCCAEAVAILRLKFGWVPFLGLSADAAKHALTRCLRCGYDLRGLRDARCPECGLECRDQHPSNHAPRNANRSSSDVAPSPSKSAAGESVK